MGLLDFWKMNGSGNDFILIDNRAGLVKEEDMGRLVARACRRRESVGADGVIFVVPSETADFGWRFFNADGGEAEMCGNGGRCVARFAFLKGIAGPSMTFETRVGPIQAEVHDRVVKVLMPTPHSLNMDVDLEFQEGWVACDSLNTGVPHVVVEVMDLARHPVVEQGRWIRFHPHFAPAGTNANFAHTTGPHQIEIRTYERGVEDETLACGTGSMAAALIAVKRGRVLPPVSVKTAGGEVLTIHLEQKGDAFERVWLEGNTSIVYKGELHAEAL